MNIISDKNTFISQAKSLISGENNLYANLSNLSSLYKEYISDINWVGFYLVDKQNENLVLGPFQGKVACVRIPFNKGVCGFCYTNKKYTYVEDVHKFPGHIACDSASNSELVVPIMKNNEVVALLDIDSTTYNRFTPEEIDTITYVTNIIFEHISF